MCMGDKLFDELRTHTQTHTILRPCSRRRNKIKFLFAKQTEAKIRLKLLKVKMVKQAVFNRLYADGQKELKKREKVYKKTKA